MSESIEPQRYLLRDRIAWLSLSFFVLFLSGSMHRLLAGSRPLAIDSILVGVTVGCCLWISSRLPTRFSGLWIVAACVGSSAAALLLRVVVRSMIAGSVGA